MAAMDAELAARLDRIDAKLDYIVERQRFVESFVRDMTPVGREALGVMADKLAEYEEKGWFALGTELYGLVDRIAESYEPADIRELSDSIVQILDTVRNVTQPDVLDLANEATDVLHHADDLRPVGPFGVLKAAGDEEVQRGMAVGLEILRHLGRARQAMETAHRARPARPEPAKHEAPAAPRASASAPEPRVTASSAAAASVPPAGEVVEWEGRRFDSEGFLLDPSDWDEDLARKMAAALGIALSDDHWTVLRWARADYLSTGASPNVRRVSAGSGVGTRRMYALFPKTPGKVAAMLAGIPKPVGCV